jgi:hypothetical protein
MPASSSPSSSGDDRDSSLLFTWPLVAVIALTVGFIIFLMCQRMTAQTAAITAISTIGTTIFVVQVPRRISDLVKLLNQVMRNLSEVERHLGEMSAIAAPAVFPPYSPEPATQATAPSSTPPLPSSSPPGIAAPGVGQT